MIPVDSIDITLSSGQIATIEMSEEFLRRVRETFALNENQKPTSEQVKFFLARSMQNALEVQS